MLRMTFSMIFDFFNSLLGTVSPMKPFGDD